MLLLANVLVARNQNSNRHKKADDKLHITEMFKKLNSIIFLNTAF